MWQCDQCLIATNSDDSITCAACEALKPGLSAADKAAFEAKRKAERDATLAKFRSEAGTGFAFGTAPANQASDVAPQPQSQAGGFVFGFSGTSEEPPAPFVPTPKTTVCFGWTPGAQTPAEHKNGESVGKHKNVAKPEEDTFPTGSAYVHGSGECDQLGLGEGVLERKKPTQIKNYRFTAIAVGALHTLALSAEGRVLSWGCNDDGALGREAGETGDNAPGEVELPASVSGSSVVALAAGDSHSLFLDAEGGVWFSGVFKDSAGHLGGPGATEEKTKTPVKLNGYLGRKEKVVAISSGANHAAIVAEKKTGRVGLTVYMFGNDEFGQLGSGDREDVSLLDERTALELRHSARGKRRTLAKLTPHPLVWEEKRQGRVEAVWCTANATYLKTGTGQIFACGLNNGGQLGVSEAAAVRTFSLHERLSRRKIAKVVGGSFHALALTEEGTVLAWGSRADYCGVGKASGAVKEPTELEQLEKVVAVAAGSSHCVASDAHGDVYTWGFGETYQLGNCPRNIDNPKEQEPECKDELKPHLVDSKQLRDKFVFAVGAGAQHTVELAWDEQYAAPMGGALTGRKRPREGEDVTAGEEPETKRTKH